MERKPEEWEALETDLHRQMYLYYCDMRAMDENRADAHDVAVFNTSVKFKMKNADAQNIAKMMHWSERYSADFLKLPAESAMWGKEQYRQFVQEAVEKINLALKGAQLENGITNAKDLKAVTDALEKLARLDLLLMGEAAEHIAIDINKMPDEMTDEELKNAITQLQKRLPSVSERLREKEETDDDGGGEEE